MFTLLVIVIILALIFDYINGFHDAANAIATVVSTKVLTPFQAVLWAAFFNFVAYFIFDHGVAETVGKIVKSDYVTLYVILSGLVAAISWNLLTWWFGIPSSSSHTLIGGFAGSAIAHAYLNYHSSGLGIAEIVSMDKIIPTVMFILFAPLIGMITAFVISVWFLNSFRKTIWTKLISGVVIIGMIWLFSHKMHDPLKDTEQMRIEYVKAAQNLTSTKALFLGKEINEQEKKVLDKAHVSFMVKRKNYENANKLLTSNKPYFLKLILFGHNIKWFLLSFIVISMAIFSLFLSSLNYQKSERWFKRMQLVSSAAFSIGHGGNDSQKVMGIIMAAYVAYNPALYSLDSMVGWVPLACYTVIGLGTLSGGWKIIKTMGTKITKVTPFEGVAAETAGAITLFITEMLKIPVSTTHTITGSIIGVGATKRLSAVRWGVTVGLLWAWILTIPISALFGGVIYLIIHFFI